MSGTKLRQYLNFFQPSMKLASKEREGARVTKRYDAAQTPYQRLLAARTVEEAVKSGLRQHYEGLDPVLLLGEMERLQDRFWQHAWREAATISAAAEGAPRLEEAPTPRRYRRTKKEPVPHTWRTREDPFEGVWEQVRLRLEINPSQSAKQLLQALQQQYPDRISGGQLRTLQRRVRHWRREQLYWAVARRSVCGLPKEAGLALPCGDGAVVVAGELGTMVCEATVAQ